MIQLALCYLRQGLGQCRILANVGDLRIVCLLGPRGPRPLAGTPTRSQTRRRASWLGPRGGPGRQRWPSAPPKPAVRYGAGGGHLDARVGCWVVGLSPMDPMTKWTELQHQRRPGTTGGFRAPNRLRSRVRSLETSRVDPVPTPHPNRWVCPHLTAHARARQAARGLRVGLKVLQFNCALGASLRQFELPP